MLKLDLCDGNIVVDTADGSGSIGSDLPEACPACGHMACEFYSCPESRASQPLDAVISRLQYNAGCDGIESLILALACAGFNVVHPDFQTAVQTALDSVANRFGD